MKNVFLTVALVAGFLAVPVASQDQPNSISERLSAADGAFETGAFQTFRAVETLFQDFYTHGIGTGLTQFIGLSLRGLPRTDREPPDPDQFRRSVIAFTLALDEARETLAKTDAETATPFVLDINALWFDVNSNGLREQNESVAFILRRTLLRQRPSGEVFDAPLDVRFDAADHAWLVAYTHVLSAGAETVLAFDPTPVFADLLEAREMLQNLPEIPYAIDVAAIEARIAQLKAEQEELDEALGRLSMSQKDLRETINTLKETIANTSTPADKTALENQVSDLKDELQALSPEVRQLNTELSFLRVQIRAAEFKLPVGDDPVRQRQTDRRALQVAQLSEEIDAVYALLEVLRQPPDATHVKKLEMHLRAMLEHNRLFWSAVVKETDDDREWIPNAGQTSAIGLTVPTGTADAWQTLLSDAEAVLDGRLLIPHPLLAPDTGIDLSAWFENPSALDPVGWVHGRDAYPYLAKGPRIDPESWFAFQRQTFGNGFAFALFFN